MRQNDPLHEPSDELQALADMFIERDYRGTQGDATPDWVNFLKWRAPGVLDYPVMQWINAIVRAQTPARQRMLKGEGGGH